MPKNVNDDNPYYIARQQLFKECVEDVAEELGASVTKGSNRAGHPSVDLDDDDVAPSIKTTYHTRKIDKGSPPAQYG